jgi:hypothetical protein
MKNEDINKPKEEKLASTKKDNETNSGKEHIDPINKNETMEERARREHWTDIAESHLGIDE